jgi:hypothetical protein
MDDVLAALEAPWRANLGFARNRKRLHPAARPATEQLRTPKEGTAEHAENAEQIALRSPRSPRFHVIAKSRRFPAPHTL